MTHNLANYRYLDLTQTLHPNVPSWTGSCGFEHEVKMDYDQGVRVLKYHMHAGIGTHMDAPSHFFKEGRNIADIPLEELACPLRIIDVSKAAHPEYFISVEDLKQHENIYGKIPKGALVCGHTGWASRWSDPKSYRNEMRFPGFSKEAARLLFERQVAGIGIDTLSPDGSDTQDFPVHKLFLGAGKYLIENLTNLDRAPPSGASVIAFPPKLKSGTEVTLRVVAII
ncbi:MAG: cyclase family protein [Simkaniaceae bacterium]|nr:cyclase family protein [Simkaniaceae bacterium]